MRKQSARKAAVSKKRAVVQARKTKTGVPMKKKTAQEEKGKAKKNKEPVLPSVDESTKKPEVGQEPKTILG